MLNTKDTLSAIKAVLSIPRVGTYEAATTTVRDDDPSAIALYAWNAAISSAMLAPLHICEVVVRNAVADAIEALYGPRWPWSVGFERSLSRPLQPWLYDPRKDLENARRRQHTTGKVIPELKFVFWQQMFDSRHEARIWNRRLRQVFPNLDGTKTVAVLRQEIHDSLEEIRMLRNRIAHHEPIFRRNLAGDFQTIVKLVEYRSPSAASWMLANQHASVVLNSSRAFVGGRMWAPSHDEIAFQAYRIWEAERCPHGQADAHWHRAHEFLIGNRWWEL
jgi:hypothetical protein